ncbi:hypothetical protein [Natrialba sp. PRR66]|uniref:hypothetical protein n=1 Tax=Natrialba sp. PRR66 TaxID=3098146 RepID=UPI002B1D0262|nr:hypothetical protein [Natrialba sp. PRR66]
MQQISEVHFTTHGKTENRQLIDRYILDAVERLPQQEFCDHAAFMPLTHDAVGGSNIWITVAGDMETLVDHESDDWDDLVEEGFVSEWDVTEVTEDWYEIAGEQGGELLLRLHRVANQATKAAFEEFETPPAPVDSYPEEDAKHPVGWWMVLDTMSGHQEYSFEERVEAFLYGIRHKYEDVSKLESPEKAAQQIDECIQSLETFRNEIQD